MGTDQRGVEMEKQSGFFCLLFADTGCPELEPCMTIVRAASAEQSVDVARALGIRLKGPMSMEVQLFDRPTVTEIPEEFVGKLMYEDEMKRFWDWVEEQEAAV